MSVHLILDHPLTLFHKTLYLFLKLLLSERLCIRACFIVCLCLQPLKIDDTSHDNTGHEKFKIDVDWLEEHFD